MGLAAFRSSATADNSTSSDDESRRARGKRDLKFSKTAKIALV